MPDADAIRNGLKMRAAIVEQYLGACFADADIPPRLREAMRYSLLAGGKRLRPVLCLETSALFGVDSRQSLPFAAALEMIHTYSLIHDDLPCMDNDDLRRGRPTCHKAFDEATALLAGDALLSDAFWFMANAGGDLAADRVLAAVRETACAVGSRGMVGGQALDLAQMAGKVETLAELRHIHALKTGALLGGASGPDLQAVSDYGADLGLAFQIVDDILDVVGDARSLGKNPGNDVALGKTTYPSLLGLDASRALAEEASMRAMRALEAFSGPQAGFLAGLARVLVDRVN
jgi:geranylgeranyl diphosphate synthase type II